MTIFPGVPVVFRSVHAGQVRLGAQRRGDGLHCRGHRGDVHRVHVGADGLLPGAQRRPGNDGEAV